MSTAVVLLLGLVLAGCSGGAKEQAATETSSVVETAPADGAGEGTANGAGDGAAPSAADEPTADAAAPDGGAADDATGDDPEVPAESGSIPDGWPAAVQVVPGPIVEGVEVGEGHYMVTIAVAEGGRAVFDAGADLLTKAGHAEVFRLDEDDDNFAGSWTKDEYTVAFDVSTTSGVWYASYVVAQSD